MEKKKKTVTIVEVIGFFLELTKPVVYKGSCEYCGVEITLTHKQINHQLVKRNKVQPGFVDDYDTRLFCPIDSCRNRIKGKMKRTVIVHKIE